MITLPEHHLPARTPTELLTAARRGLAEAAQTRPDGLRYATAHLAALRAAAAVLASRARAGRRRQPVRGVWTLLPTVAPELGEWAAPFAAEGAKRAAAEAGVPQVVTAQDADEAVQRAWEFITAVEAMLAPI